MAGQESTGRRPRRRAVGPAGARPAEPRTAAHLGNSVSRPDDRADERPEEDEERLLRDVPPHHGA